MMGLIKSSPAKNNSKSCIESSDIAQPGNYGNYWIKQVRKSQIEILSCYMISEKNARNVRYLRRVQINTQPQYLEISYSTTR